MIEKILERLEEEYTDITQFGICDDYAKGLLRGVEIAKEIVQEVAKDGGWIPVEKKLPKEGTPVLVCNEEGRVFIRQVNWISSGRTKNPNWSQGSTGIIAWQPLPAPYQKGE